MEEEREIERNGGRGQGKIYEFLVELCRKELETKPGAGESISGDQITVWREGFS